ncbi:MAG: PQQ-dependent sugar dehydrogenase, partial [Thermoproteota archaeon]|nr:PQQ-dependent sugar dehydrogenase [Thermoproteota archaeon]
MTLFQNSRELFVFLALLISLWLLVFPSITISRLQQQQQQQDPSSIQQLLPKQTAVLSQQSEAFDNNTPAPTLDDSDLEVELVTEGLESPTSMAFIGNHGDMLILEKSGEVILLTGENKSKLSLLNLTVNDQNERGLLGVAVLNNMSDSNTTAVATSSDDQTITTREDDDDNNNNNNNNNNNSIST